MGIYMCEIVFQLGSCASTCRIYLTGLGVGVR